VEVNEMDMNQFLEEKHFTKFQLSKRSGIPLKTITNICSGKVKLEDCSGIILYKISKILDVSIDSLLKDELEIRPNFEIFKSSICHWVHFKGDLDFLIDTLESGEIFELYEKKWYVEALYLLAMVDYISRENNFPLCADYNDLRQAKLRELLYPAGVLILSATGNNTWKDQSRAEAIPEFMRHNIVEADVRNVI
jgi:transcriptional regulator with XRE-family HTH domain